MNLQHNHACTACRMLPGAAMCPNSAEHRRTCSPAHGDAYLPLEQGLEERLIACQVRQLARGRWDVFTAHIRLEVALADLLARTTHVRTHYTMRYSR